MLQERPLPDMAYGCSDLVEIEASDIVLGNSPDVSDEPYLPMFRTGEVTDHADVVKSLHAHLREEVNSGRDPSEVWQELLCDSVRLKEYSIAMHSLATQRWLASASLGAGEGGHGCSRILWCVEVCGNYYGEERAMHRHLLKDLRRKSHDMATLVVPALLPGSEEKVRDVVSNMAAGSRVLLDVGSCFNPFSSFQGFEVTAIDIAPAHQSVQKCDFLSVPIVDVKYGSFASSTSSSSTSPSTTSSITLSTSSSSNTYSSMVLCRESYHVVVFSLFLSYLPLPRQRLECCIKAHQLLKPHGLLLIVTPDSSHQNKHAGMMKNWKNSIQAIGFHRCNYVKHTHLHCMAFRKTTITHQNSNPAELHGLHIPQDRTQRDMTRPLPSKHPASISHCLDQTTTDLSCHLPFSNH